VAGAIGFTFREKGFSKNVFDAMTEANMFEFRYDERFRNIMTGTRNGLDVTLFDFYYVESGGRVSYRHGQTWPFFRVKGSGRKTLSRPVPLMERATI
jgi:hypothetical protein